jgi:hypothetical protein
VYKDTDEVPKKTLVTQLSVSRLLGVVRDIIHAEIIEVWFDYVRLHQQCWHLLRMVRERCWDDLIKIFGPDYMVKES